MSEAQLKQIGYAKAADPPQDVAERVGSMVSEAGGVRHRADAHAVHYDYTSSFIHCSHLTSIIQQIHHM